MALDNSTNHKNQFILPAIIISVAIVLSTVIFSTSSYLQTPRFEISEMHLIDHKSNKIYFILDGSLYLLDEPYPFQGEYLFK